MGWFRTNVDPGIHRNGGDTGAGMGSKSATGWGIGLAALGALCLIAAAVLYWAVVPDRKQLPGDTDTTRQFNGTAKFLLIPQALATGDLRSAVVTNTPVTAQRQVKVLATDGDAAQVSDSRSVSTEAGAPVGRTEATYAVDRRTLEATSDFPNDWTVVPHEGLTVSWPIGAEKQDYPAWINETQTTTTARYVREEDKAGVATYVFQADAPAAPIKDEQVLASLPKALPVSVLSQLGSVLQLPPQVQAQLAQALPSLGNPVPINYTYESTSTIWVEPTSGVVVDIQREEIRKAGVGPAGSVAALRSGLRRRDPVRPAQPERGGRRRRGREGHHRPAGVDAATGAVDRWSRRARRPARRCSSPVVVAAAGPGQRTQPGLIRSRAHPARAYPLRARRAGGAGRHPGQQLTRLVGLLDRNTDDVLGRLQAAHGPEVALAAGHRMGNRAEDRAPYGADSGRGEDHGPPARLSKDRQEQARSGVRTTGR